MARKSVSVQVGHDLMHWQGEERHLEEKLKTRRKFFLSYNSVMMSVSKSSLHRIGAVRVVRSSVERVLVRREIRVVWARAWRAGGAETLGSSSQPNVVRLKNKNLK